MKTKNIVQIVNGIKTETKILTVSLVIILLLGGCTPTTPNNNGNNWGDIPSAYTIEGVENIKQKYTSSSFLCATKIVFDSFGIDISEDELDSLIKNDGTSSDRKAIMEYAENKGYNTFEAHVDNEDLLNLIFREVMMIAQIRFSSEGGSIICKVPYSYDISKEEIYLKNPWTGEDLTISFANFSKYSSNTCELNDWIGVLIYDKAISIEDLDLTPFVYPCDKSYKPEKD